MKTPTLTRRQFLKTSGALVVAFNLFPTARHARAQTLLPNGDLDPAALDSWLAIAPDGKVTIFTSKVELGTGIETSLAQIAAEELDISMTQIKVIMGDTALTVDQSATGGSRSLERAGPQIRQAAAAARKELLKLAAAKLNAPADKLAVKDGVVSVSGNSNQKTSYAELVGGRKFNVRITAQGAAAELKLAEDVKAKSVKEYQTVGASVQRFDLPPKLTGEAIYINDLRIPNMLQGRVVRPPVINTEPVSIDHDSVRGIPGVVMIVRQGKFVGVVAKTEWAAIRAAQALKVAWAKPTIKLPANQEELYSYLQKTKPMRSTKAVDRGNVDEALKQAKKSYARTYRFPLQLHGMIGPSCAIADVKSDRATIWCGTQGPFRSRKNIATLLGLPEKDVRVIYYEGAAPTGGSRQKTPARTQPYYRAPSVRQFASSGLVKTNMAGRPKAQPRSTRSRPPWTATAN